MAMRRVRRRGSAEFGALQEFAVCAAVERHCR
jgi:hypothetical protein